MGLELEEYFRINPSAKVTGIDLAPRILRALDGKFADKDITLICGSYFDVPFGEGFDAAVLVESLHHFTKEEKNPAVLQAAKCTEGGRILHSDGLFSLSDQEKQLHRAELLRLKAEQGIAGNEFYHNDTPMTVEHEIEALLATGFSSMEVLDHWGPTCTLRAKWKN